MDTKFINIRPFFHSLERVFLLYHILPDKTTFIWQALIFAEWENQIAHALPEELKGSLPTIEEIERENIRVQTMEGRIREAREGLWNGGFAPCRW